MPSTLRTIWNILKETRLGRILRKIKYRNYEEQLYSDERINKALKAFNFSLEDSNKMDDLKNDLKKICKKYRFEAEEYLLYNFYEKSETEKAGFISGRERMELCALMNKGKNRELFDNKWETYLRFKPYYKREMCLVENEADHDFFIDFVNRNRSFVVKALSGHGVLRYDLESLDKGEKIFKDLIRKFENEVRPGFIAETRIVQIDDMARIHPASVNTVRITTVRLPDKVILIHPFIRFGTKGQIFDNGLAGGLICTIDIETGRVYSAMNEQGQRFDKHPDTGEQIVGFVVPKWKEACDLARQLSEIVKDNRWTGWDLALTKDGWIMVEGNCSGHFIGWQMNDQIGFRDELMGYLKQMNLV